MPNYKNGKIYSIRCYNDDTLIYVGSTTQALAKRWYEHKSKIKSYNELPFYKLVDDVKNWYIQLEEEFSCDNKEQLEKRELEIMRDISTLNRKLNCIFKHPSKLQPPTYTQIKSKLDTDD